MEEYIYIRLVIVISIGGYFLGSILFSKLFPRIICGIDIVAVSEDGNPGTSNVCKYCGAWVGALCGICDFGKAFAPVVIANALIPVEVRTPLFGLVIGSAVIGHIFSIFNHGNGGMGVAPMFGSLIAVYFQCKLFPVLVAIYVVVRYLCRVKHQHLRTILCFGIFMTVTALFVPNIIYKLTYITLSAIICAKCLYIAARQRNAGEEVSVREG